jgi:hypothetical protein
VITKNVTDAGTHSNSAHMGSCVVMTVLKIQKQSIIEDSNIEFIFEMPPDVKTEKSRFDREFKHKSFIENVVKDSVEWTSRDKLIFHCHIINNDSNAVVTLLASILALVYQYING